MPTIQDPEKAAEGLLDFMWAQDGEIPLPVDPIQIATNLGIQVFNAELEQRISGSIVKEPGSDAVILLNSSDSRSRRRFTCAHELGHFVKRSASGDEDFEFVDYRGPVAAAGDDVKEVFANKFAAALLMPRDLVKKVGGDLGWDAFRLAARFGVSVESMNYRLKNLGFVT